MATARRSSLTKKICSALLIPPVARGGLREEGGARRGGDGGMGHGCEEEVNVEDAATFDYYFSWWKRGLEDVQLLFAVP